MGNRAGGAGWLGGPQRPWRWDLGDSPRLSGCDKNGNSECPFLFWGLLRARAPGSLGLTEALGSGHCQPCPKSLDQ